MVYHEVVSLSSRGNTDVIDVTAAVERVVRESGVTQGVVTAFVTGSTAAMTTIEFEGGLVRDVKEFFERILPRDHAYAHNNTWADDNGHSHLRASLVGPSITIPIVDGRLVLGTWQQIICLDFDTRPRSRQITVQVFGEA